MFVTVVIIKIITNATLFISLIAPSMCLASTLFFLFFYCSFFARVRWSDECVQ